MKPYGTTKKTWDPVATHVCPKAGGATIAKSGRRKMRVGEFWTCPKCNTTFIMQAWEKFGRRDDQPQGGRTHF